MKKILLILIALVLVGGAVFAQDAPEMPAPVFKGSATLSWGIDLGYGTDKYGSALISHGFLNEATASVSLPFVKSGSKKGEGDVYALINLDGVKLGLEADLKAAKATGKIDKVEAKIVFYGAYITVYNAPEMKTKYAADATSLITDDNYGIFNSGFGGYGTKIGYANPDLMDLDVGIKFTSNGSWKDRDGSLGAEYVETVTVKANRVNGTGSIYVKDGHELRDMSGKVVATGPGWKRVPSGQYMVYKSAYYRYRMNGHYGLGIDFHMAPVEKYLTVDANFNMTFDTAGSYRTDVESNFDDMRVMNVGAMIKSEPIDGLMFKLGFDGGHAFKKTSDVSVPLFAWALGFGTEYKNSKAGTIDAGLYVSSDGTPYGNGSTFDPYKLNLVPDGKGGVEEKPLADGSKPGRGITDIAFTVGYSGLPAVEGLDLHARLNVFGLLNKISKEDRENGWLLPLGLNVGAGYKAMLTDSIWIKPYADLWGETNSSIYSDDTPKSEQKRYFGLAYKVGLAVSPMERLTIDLNWSHGKAFAPGAVMGKGLMFGAGQWRSAPCQHKADNGRFILSAKITY
ncbi:MSP porin [Treponema pedis]|uniref:major outer sheath protein Msp n=1 Tax=Treponema pedis TaxID=409322 RepID=UPI003133D511